MTHKFDSLYYVYDVGFRWGPPDLTYPDPLRPEGSALGISKIDLYSPKGWAPTVSRWSQPTCEVPGCYVCKRDRDGNLYPRFP